MDSRERIWKFYRRHKRPISAGNAKESSKLLKSAPNLDLYLWRPVISEPSLCTLAELDNGTYSYDDLLDMHEALDLLRAMNE